MDFNSLPTLIGLILGVVLLDAVLMIWLRRRKKTSPRRPDGVYVMGQFSPLLTGLRQAPDTAGRVWGLFRSGTIFPKIQGKISAFASWLRRLATGWAAAALKRRNWLRPLCFAGAFAMGLAGQVQLFGEHILSTGAPWLLFSGAWWLCGCLLTKDDTRDEPAGALQPAANHLIKRKDIRILALMLAVQMTALAVILYWNKPAQESHLDIFGLWLASILLYLLAFWPGARRTNLFAVIKDNWKKLIPFVLIFLLAAGLRFYRLGSLPAIMENDEGTVGMRALEVVQGLRMNMFEDYGGYGTLYFFLQALPVMLFGRNMLALRLVTALAGTLTIPLAAWLGWRLFGYRTALAAALLLAASHLHVQFSRVSPTAGSFDPLFTCALALLLYDAITRRGLHRWAAAGVVMGVAMHFYVGARVMVIITLAVIAGVWLLKRDLLRGQAAGLAATAGGLLVSAGPLLSWAVRDPAGFNQRVNQVGIIQNGWLEFEMALRGLNFFQVLSRQAADALLIFNYYPAAWFYEAAAPAMGLLGGLLLFFGLILSLTRLRRLPYLLLAAWFWVTLVTGQVLMLDPAANAYRTLGLMPAACFLAAEAGVLLADEFGRLWRNHASGAALALLALLVFAEAGWNIHYYFDVWGRAGSYGDENTRRASLIGSYLSQFSGQQEIIVAGGPEFDPQGWNALDFLKDQAAYMPAAAPLAETIPALAPSPQAVVVVPAPMQAELEKLKIRYPAGIVTPYVFERKLYFWSMVLNGE